MIKLSYVGRITPQEWNSIRRQNSKKYRNIITTDKKKEGNIITKTNVESIALGGPL